MGERARKGEERRQTKREGGMIPVDNKGVDIGEVEQEEEGVGGGEEGWMEDGIGSELELEWVREMGGSRYICDPEKFVDIK